jgi:phosphohistidine swiveling domain-containing protein
MSDTTVPSFHPPGPGVWELETVHFSRPACRFIQEPLLEGFGAGFALSTARYGVMLDRMEPAFVNDFTFMQPRPFGAPPGAKGPPPKIIFQLLMRLVPKIRARLRTSHEAFEKKQWRIDLAEWDERVRPAADKRHREIQAVDPSTLSDQALLDHVKVCRDQFRDMIKQHHTYTVTCCLPVGDLLAHVGTWTGKPHGEILQVLRGSSKISLGVAHAELDRLASAIRADAASKAALAATDAPDAVLERLKTHPGDVGKAMRDYLDVVSYRTLGYDVSGKYALEMPTVVVGAIRAAVDGERAADDGIKTRIAKLRGQVPEAHQAKFDELVEEARTINRLRDERGHHSDGWATGLLRRALLDVGHRLVKKGAIDDAELAVDASFDELKALIGGKGGPALDELKRRAKWRATRSVNDTDIPRSLGGEPGGPPPAEWLPEHGRRAQRAMSAFLGSLFGEPELSRTEVSVKGLPVSPGTYEGIARLVETEDDFDRIQQGDVLVTRATSPYFNVVLPLLGAIVTDRGGQLSHAAIVSREYGIPGVVGTREATKLVKDGARVRVDGTLGEVTVLG